MARRENRGSVRGSKLSEARRRRIRFAAVAGLALAAVLTGGCAVTTIDVDVYKGPLSNEDGVQTEQVAALAIAAEPMLVQLRDSLAKIDRKSPHYVPRFMPPTVLGVSRFDDVQANRVNGLLSLYEDETGDPRVRDMIGRGQSALRSVHAALQVLDRSPDADRAAWDAVKGLQRKRAKNDTDAQYQVRRDLFDAYRKLLRADSANEYRDVDSLMRAHARAQQLFPTRSPHANLPATFLDEHGNVDLTGSGHERGFTTAAYTILSQPTVVAWHASLMLDARPEDSCPQKLIHRVTELSGAFIDAREAVDQGLTLTLKYLVLASSRGDADDDNRAFLINQIASLASSLINYDNRCETFEHMGFSPVTLDRLRTYCGAEDELRTNVTAATMPSHDLKRAYGGVRKHDKELSESIAGDLSIDAINGGGALAAELLNAHQARDPHMPDQRFGLAKGPDIARLPGLSNVTEVIELFSSVASSSTGAGYDRGRPDRGLKSLVEDYLGKRGLSQTDDKRLAAEKALHDDLVQFAEKLLFVANHDSLLRESSDDPNVSRYVRILQAVGNEILVSVNERRNKRNYDRGGESLGKQEVNAIYGTLPRNTADVLRRVAALLDVERQAAQNVQAQAQKESASLEKQIADVNKSIDAL